MCQQMVWLGTPEAARRYQIQATLIHSNDLVKLIFRIEEKEIMEIHKSPKV